MGVIESKVERDAVIDVFEHRLMELEPIELPLTHRFTDGMYIREIFMPKGALLTSAVHKTNHPYVISKGICKVFDGNDVVTLAAPHTGITEANTRRLILIEEDTIWTTFHITDKKDLEEIEADTIEPYRNDLLDQKLLDQFNKITRGNNTFIHNTKSINKEDE